ncbi:hypothetical protein [Paracoccus jeotgali]|uniref:hypothetical protein n=1 Tax=Paracoccus jeotgali TaxID=2065379 RepID=UPI0028AC7BCB|nr:hypothetical protein [Paracoccus jeotgali]
MNQMTDIRPDMAQKLPGTLLSVEDELNRLRDVLTLLNMATAELPKEEGAAMSAGIHHAHALLDRASDQLKRLRTELNPR